MSNHARQAPPHIKKKKKKTCCFAHMPWQEFLGLSVSKWLCHCVPIMASFSDPCLWLITRQMRMIVKSLSHHSKKKMAPAVRHQRALNPHFCVQKWSVCVSGSFPVSVRWVIQHVLAEGGRATTVVPRAVLLSFLSWWFSAPVMNSESSKWLSTDSLSTQAVNYHFC